jgi:hypothetical protein
MRSSAEPVGGMLTIARLREWPPLSAGGHVHMFESETDLVLLLSARRRGQRLIADGGVRRSACLVKQVSAVANNFRSCMSPTDCQPTVEDADRRCCWDATVRARARFAATDRCQSISSAWLRWAVSPLAGEQ